MGRVLSEPELIEAVSRERANGRTIAFANGCFDLLHVGHVRYLRGAAREADRLIVAVDDEGSLARVKGAGGAAMAPRERAGIIPAVGAGVYGVSFSDQTGERPVGRGKPDLPRKS